jgi:hypothetical protein
MLSRLNELSRYLNYSKLEFLSSDFADNSQRLETLNLVLSDNNLLTDLYKIMLVDNPKVQKNNIKSKCKTFVKSLSDTQILEAQPLRDISKEDKGFTDKQDLAEKTQLEHAKRLNLTPYIYRVTQSGFDIALYCIQFLKDNKHVKFVLVESVDRLSRNVENLVLLLRLLRYCMINQITILVNGQIANRGQNRLLTLMLGVFADYEITQKQTAFSHQSLNVVKFELGLKPFSDLSDKEITLLTKMQNVTQDDYLAKIFQKASKYIYNYEKEIVNDNGKRKANNVKLYNNALEVVNLINEHTD